TDLTFKADFSTTINENGYEVGDSVIVRYGYFGSAMEVGVAGLTKEGLFGNLYSVTIPDVVLNFGDELYYQYYKLNDDGAEYREVYFNFDYNGDTPSEAERRAVVITAEDNTVMDDVISTVDARRQPLFRNTNAVGGHVTVSYTVDMRPAYWHVDHGITLNDIQGNFDISRSGQIDTLGVFMNGPATGEWTGWGISLSSLEDKQLFDDGTHGDVTAGDNVYTLQFEYAPDSTNNVIGQEFKFGIGGGDNESSYGLNHIENINDASDTYTIASAWGSINPNFYYLWDYDTMTGTVGVDEFEVPNVLSLAQNYPNPFNPTTSINYVLPQASDVQLIIYNALGQEVRTLKAGHSNAGSYSVNWDGLDHSGNMVSSGLYIYTLTTGDQSISKKMLMLK
ncbi:MAG: T9SS type A sorting domain-containing protein, partial [Candidatus Marinimicrobia bacterium]|nr:T9SS type A sorting domain-containing protein [Candidatus Neomarinimicrobiota bacterium]